MVKSKCPNCGREISILKMGKHDTLTNPQAGFYKKKITVHSEKYYWNVCYYCLAKWGEEAICESCA